MEGILLVPLFYLEDGPGLRCVVDGVDELTDGALGREELALFGSVARRRDQLGELTRPHEVDLGCDSRPQDHLSQPGGDHVVLERDLMLGESGRDSIVLRTNSRKSGIPV